MQQSIVRRTIGPPGMVRHLFNVRHVSMYHDGPQCPNYDGHSSTTTELSVSFCDVPLLDSDEPLLS